MIARARPTNPVNPNEPALDITGVSKTFGEIKALQDISLTIKAGEFTALIGPSGSGKSTLLKLCNGLITSDPTAKASIKLLGTPIQSQGKLSPSIRKTRARIGFIFQSFNLVPRLSLHSNVLVGATSRTPTWRTLLYHFHSKDRAKAMQALHQVGLASKASQRAGTLSGGQQQRGAIARAITQGAQVVLADEPVASLDPKSSHRVMAALSDLAEQGVTVVVSLHQIDLAKKYCQRIIALNQGRIHFTGTADDLDESRLRSIYGDAEDFGQEVSSLEPTLSSNEKIPVYS